MFRLRSLVVLLAFGTLFLAARPGVAAPQKDRCVIMVSVDGLANFYLDDPKADMPTIRKLAATGARAEGGMVGIFPSVTWPNHAALVTGTTAARHGVIGNRYFDRAQGQVVALILDRVLNKDQTVQVPTVYDAAHAAGLSTASVCWPATREAKSIDWAVPDMFQTDDWTKYGTKTWLEELRLLGWPVDSQGPWCAVAGGGVMRDWLYTRMVRQVFQEHKPNLVLLHLVEPDHTQHAHGPRSPEAYWCASYADDRIRDLVDAIQNSPRAAHTTLFVVSDHGFFPIHYDIRPNVVLRKLGLIGTGPNAKRAACCVAEGGACSIYVLDASRRAAIVAQLRTELAKLEGVQAVFDASQFAQIGQPTPEQNPRGADLWLAAKYDYSFSESADGEAVSKRKTPGGTHGYLPDQPDMRSTCVVWGAGIKPGTHLGKIRSVDVAPTIANLLGIELPTAEGQALSLAAP